MTVIEVDIRDAAIAKDIHALRLASYSIESELIDYPALPALHEQMHEVQESDERFLACVEGDEKIIGSLSFVLSANELDICSLTVHPDYFGKGIASQLLREVESFREYAPRIIVSTAQKNVPAVRLYQKHEYVIYDQPVLPDGLALVKLEKWIISVGSLA